MQKQYVEKVMKNTFIDFMSTEEFLKSPLVFDKSEGVYIWDVEGKRYFDAIGGVFVASLGHKHPRIVEAMKKQIDTLTLAPPLHGIADVTLKFIEKVGSVTPGNLNYVKAYCGGSESIEGTLKCVRQYFKQTGYPDKTKVISNYLSYHGATFAAMSAGGSKRKTKFEPQVPGFIKVFNPKQLRDQFPSWEENCRFCANLVRTVIDAEDPETVAAFLVEPICNTAGIIAPTEEYYQILRSICDEYNVMLIFDEVLTGIGKTGNMFAAQTYGVTPDIICAGKGLASGMLPLGSMMANEKIARAFEGPAEDKNFFAHGHTFANFPLSCAIGTEVLNVIEEEGLIAHTKLMGEKLFVRLESLKKYGVIREVRGRGTLLGVELVKDTVTNTPYEELGVAFKKTALKNGIILRVDPDWFAVAPPLITTDAQIDEMCDLIEVSLKDALDLVAGNKQKAK